uniref:Myb-like protein AA n=1 Tax=Schistosoma mansoni TaxID=6183 RepID=A0A3Q0KHX9_SCHMA
MSSTHSNRSTPISRTTSTTTTTTKTTTTTAYSYEHPDKESLAATKIQAGYRGYCTRKKYGNLSLNSSLPSSNYPSISTRQSYTIHQSPLRNNNNNNNNDLENAATRIQASYRGYLTRKALRDDNDNITQKQYKPIKNVPYYSNDKINKTNNDHNIDNNNDDDIDGKVKAVTKIQAGYRGYKTRKSLAPLLNHHHHNQHHLISNKENQNYLDYKTIQQERDNSNSHMNTYSLYDPELAATKIQATFRGYRTRRHLPK